MVVKLFHYAIIVLLGAQLLGYAQHIEKGTVVYAGVDYEEILRQVGTRLSYPRRP